MNPINILSAAAAETRFKDQYFPGQGQTKKFVVITTLAALSNYNNDGVKMYELKKILTNGQDGSEGTMVHRCVNYLLNAQLIKREVYGRSFNKPAYKYFLTESGLQLISYYNSAVSDIKRKLKRGEKI